MQEEEDLLARGSTAAMSIQIGAQFPDETPIERLDLQVRTYNCLKRSGVNTIGQILGMDKAALLSIRNFRPENVAELREKLITSGFMSSDKPLGPFAEEDTAE